MEPKFQELDCERAHKFQELEPKFQELDVHTWDWTHEFQVSGVGG
jgi:hypothetical protein